MKVPHEIRRCRSCGLEGLAKGDTPFKGIQMNPRSPDLHWYCDKKICKEAMDQAVVRAQVIWQEAHS